MSPENISLLDQGRILLRGEIERRLRFTKACESDGEEAPLILGRAAARSLGQRECDRARGAQQLIPQIVRKLLCTNMVMEFYGQFVGSEIFQHDLILRK